MTYTIELNDDELSHTFFGLNTLYMKMEGIRDECKKNPEATKELKVLSSIVDD